MTDGIVTRSAFSPPAIRNSPPSSLNTITASAPACCAAYTLSEKSHVPREISATLFP